MFLKELWRLRGHEKFRVKSQEGPRRGEIPHIGSGVWKDGRSIRKVTRVRGENPQITDAHESLSSTSKLQCSEPDLNPGGGTDVGNLVKALEWAF